MKINNKVFICTLLVLIIFFSINACSAEETLDESLGTDACGEISVSETPIDKLSDSEDTYVDGNANGEFTPITDAVGNADGEETTLIKNDESTLNADQTFENESSNIMGNEEPIVLPEGTIYVSESGDDSNDGLSEENAILTLVHAVDIVKNRENKTATIYVLNGDYTTGAIDISDDVGVSLSIIGQDKDQVIIHGTGSYIFDIYGDNLVWNFKNLDFDGLDSTSRTSAALVLYSKNGNFTVDNCNFRNINTKLGAIAIGNDNGNTDVTNCIIEDVTGSASSTSILTINGDGKFVLDNITIRNCKLNDDVASSTTSSYLRSILYVNTYEADVTLSNSKIRNNNGPVMSFIESRAKLTIINTTISDNVVDTSLNGANGGDMLIWANNDDSCNINISQCTITNNTITKSGKGLFHNQKGSMNVEYSDISRNTVDKFIGSTGTITANNNWWGTNDQPDAKVDNWVIMNVEVDDSELSDNNKITLTIDFNHVKTSSGNVEELTRGEIPKDSYTVYASAQEGEITPSEVVINKGEVKVQTFTVTENNDVITLTCDGDVVELTIVGDEPYNGIVYVSKTGDDNNNGSIDAPVATVAKAIELANAGSGQIIIYEGNYLGNMYHVTHSLNITGVGNVVLDANNGRLFTMSYDDEVEQLILTNLVLTGADDNYGQAIYSFADELILDNVNITNNPGSGSLIKNYGKMTINNCVIANHNGENVIDISGSKDIIINNTIFENNTVTDYAVVYASSSSGNAIVENTIFRNNTGQLGIFKVSKRTTVKDSKFIDNTNKLGYGGAISDSDSLTVTNSTFINNKANKEAGAIYVGYNRVATITQSIFINNTANLAGADYHGDAIFNKGKLTINYCLLLTNAENSLIYSSSEYDANAQYNWWGTNDDPVSLNGVGTYEDELYEEVYSVIDSSNWVYMNVTTDMDDDTVIVGDTVGITVDFTNYRDLNGDLQPLSKSIHEVNVSASVIYGNLDSDVKTTSNNIATFVYDATVSAEDIVDIASSNANVQVPINVDEPAQEGVIYVSPNGNDSNDGLTKKNPVKTIAHAIEIATIGQIVLLDGVHTTGDLGNIYENLTITGKGKAIIDAQNNNRILYVGSEANVVINNVTMINGYTADESGALLGNSNHLTLINCILSNSSAGQNNGGAIFSVGRLTIINTTIANCSAKQGGAIFTQSDSDFNSLEVINSTFENNIATGYDMNGGGAIYAQRTTGFYNFDLKVDNSTFINNKAEGTSSGGAIALVQLDATAKITDSKFIANHANGKTGYGGGAIYVSSASNYYRYGTMTITGTLFENNTCGANGGAIYGRVTTVNVANSVLINNSDVNGLAVYGYKTDSASPSITLNDNWWGSNDSPKSLVGGNGYKPTLNRWAILTVTNDSAIEAGNTVKLTVSINNYTTGTVNGSMSKPISVKRDVTIKTTDEDITSTLENGEFIYDYAVPENVKYVAASVDDETVVLLVISSQVNVEIDDITARKYDKVNVVVNVTGDTEINVGVVELYADTTLIDTIPVTQGKAIKDVVISCDVGTYELIAKFIDESNLFDASESNATLVVDGVCELWNDTFFNFFNEDGLLRDEIIDEELVFHGDFSNLGVDVISIHKPIVISGDDAVIYDMAFALKDDVKLTNISLIANNSKFAENSNALIFANGQSIELNNIHVNYTTPSNSNAYGILAYCAENFKLLNSTILFDSNNRAGVTQHALQIRDCNDFLVKGNTINAYLPARDVAYADTYPYFNSVDQELVLAVGIQNGENGILTENCIDSIVKSALGDFPTVDTIMVYGAANLEISWNNITQIDTVNAGRASYCNAMDLYAFDGITVKNNNVLVNITSGMEAKGTAYPIQATGSYNALLIDHNNLTSISRGPALGIYSQNYDGSTDITIVYNNINATGLATMDEYALVSGMELQDNIAKVYNNTIYSRSIGSYDDLNALYGISYAQETANNHEFDIRDNTVYTEGKYVIYLKNAKNSNVTENYLIAKELKGDSAVSISGENNIVVNNYPGDINLSANDLEMLYKDGSAWTVTLTDGINPIGGAVVKVGILGKTYALTTDADGTVSLPITVGPGTYEVNATHEGDQGSAFVDATVTVGKAAATLTAENITMSYKNGSWIVTLTGADGVIPKAAIKFGISGKVYTIKTDDSGVAALPINLAPGTYEINATFGGNAKHESAFVEATVTVEKAVATIASEDLTMCYKDGSSYAVTVTDANGAVVAGTTVKFTFGTKSYNIKTDANGVAALPINLKIGEYTVNAIVDDAKYTSEEVTNTVSVTDYNATLVANDISMTYQDGTNYEVQLTTADGNPIAVANLVVKISLLGKTYNIKTDAEGIAKLPINLRAGNYTVTAEYNGKEITNTIVVNKA